MEKPIRTVVLGMFDGLHAGHLRLLEIANNIKREYGTETLVYTFDNHPMTITLKAAPPLLLDTEERTELLLLNGADKVVTDVFDEKLCSTEAAAFAAMLGRRFNAKHVVVGFNYTFGKGGRGDAKLLAMLGRESGFTVHIADSVLYEGEVVSSTRIRRLIENGDVEKANAMLTRNFTMKGVVRKCRQVGSKIGFPTVNIRNDAKRPLPLFGVYATRLHLDGRVYNGITNVGTNPTFGDNELSVETHVFDFNEDTYGKTVVIEFLSFIRPQKRFETVEALKHQIQSDKEAVIKLQTKSDM